MSKHPKQVEVQPGDRYALSVPPSCMISIRGMELMLSEYTEAYEGRPIGIIITSKQMNRLCIEASRTGDTFADDVSGSQPHFRGIPVGLMDDDADFDAIIVGVESD